LDALLPRDSLALLDRHGPAALDRLGLAPLDRHWSALLDVVADLYRGLGALLVRHVHAQLFILRRREELLEQFS
jgi:hypothetical protein